MTANAMVESDPTGLESTLKRPRLDLFLISFLILFLEWPASAGLGK